MNIFDLNFCIDIIISTSLVLNFWLLFLLYCKTEKVNRLSRQLFQTRNQVTELIIELENFE